MLSEIDYSETIIDLCRSKDRESRIEIFKRQVFEDSEQYIELMNTFQSIISVSNNEDDKENYQDHFNLVIEYKQSGLNALDYFLSTAQIQNKFVEFSCGISTFDKRKDFLFENLFLAEKESIKRINEFINSKLDYPSSAITSFRLCRNLLKACRRLGVERTFLEFELPEQKYFDALTSISQTDSLSDVISTTVFLKDIISSESMRNVFHYYQAHHEDNPRMRAKLVAMWDTISIFQKNTVDIWFWE